MEEKNRKHNYTNSQNIAKNDMLNKTRNSQTQLRYQSAYFFCSKSLTLIMTLFAYAKNKPCAKIFVYPL